MGVTGKVREVYGRVRTRRAGALPDAFTTPLAGLRVLEVGGPSAVFDTGGLLPLYDHAAFVDGVQWSGDTVWHHGQQDGGYERDGRRLGAMRIIDGVRLEGVEDGAYDAVASSHVIEHLADPLAALGAWRRVTGSGHLVLIAPHKDGTFDHRRPVTPLEHLLADHEAGTGEDDLTHLDEVLRLSDHRRDAEAQQDPVQWEARRRDNARWRVLHHHVFTTRSLVALLDHAGVQVLAVQARLPHDVYVVGRFVPGRPDNGAFLAPGAEALRRSPFRSDRRDAAA